MSTYADRIVDAVLSVTKGPAKLHPPLATDEDAAMVRDQLYDIGSYAHMESFEWQLTAVCRREYAVATSSGSTALELALTVVGVKYGDLVAIPAISFVAVANAVSHLGATPIFVDVEQDSFGMCPRQLRKMLAYRRGIKAIIAVHVLGHPCQIGEIAWIAHEHGIPVVEDAAEALGSNPHDGPENAPDDRYPCGCSGQVSVLSFNLNKIVTTGGGGAVLTNDHLTYEQVHHLATTARVDHPWEIAHDAVGWNHRMSMTAAALGCSQVERLQDIILAKRALADAYRKAFQGMTGVYFHDEPAGTRSNFWLPSIRVLKEEREVVLTALHKAGLGARALFTPIDQLAPYRRGSSPCHMAQKVYETTVCLPGGVELAQRFV